jgi:ketosteroid isomerase-like protein
MGQNTDTLKQGYDDFGRGDIDAVFATWHDDIKWEGGNSELPAGGDYEGKEAIGGAFGELGEAWDGLKVIPDEFIEDGDTVVVLGHIEGTGKETGQSVESPFVHIYRFEGGKVKRLQILTDTLTGARALGKV